MVQINAPEYDSDIDGQTELLLDIQPSVSSHTAHTEEVSSNAKNTEEDTAPVTSNSGEHPAFLQDSDSLNLSPNQFWIVQNIQYTRTRNNPGKNIQTTTDPN